MKKGAAPEAQDFRRDGTLRQQDWCISKSGVSVRVVHQ